jgi:hypothetical protein
MKDYHIYVHGVGSRGTGKSTSNPQNQQKENKVAVENPEQKDDREQKHSFTGLKATGFVIASASKINGYVGELTENTLRARRTQTGLTISGMVAYSFVNPILGLSALGIYAGDKAISYEIKNYKENLSANYLRQLSGGTANTGR